MDFLDGVAALVLVLEFPIPLFWLVLHPLVGFWRRQRLPAAYLTAGLSAWGIVAAVLFALRDWLFVSERASAWTIAAGFGLIALDGVILYRVGREMGLARLVGKVELDGGGHLATRGLYARVRHPRYAGAMLSVAGACLIASSLLLWVFAACWGSLVVLATMFEERELRARFGPAWDEYCGRVPRFIPFRFWPAEE